MHELEEILRCLETIQLTDPALLPQRGAELERLEMFTRELIPSSRAEIDARRLNPKTRQSPRSIV